MCVVGGCQSVEPAPTLLSLPPDARCWWSGDHLRPHTSCRCPCSLLSAVGGVLTSRWRITRSRLPDDSCSPFQARAPGRRREEQRGRLTFHSHVGCWGQTATGRLSLTYACRVALQTGQLPPSGRVPDLDVALVCSDGNQTPLQGRGSRQIRTVSV